MAARATGPGAGAVVVMAVLVAGCATGPSYLDTAEPEAVRQAVLRAESEMGCSGGKGEVLRREAQAGPPPQRAAYSVLVTSCGERRVLVVQCQDTQGCFPGTGRPAR
jgi:hypothetical protein